MFRSTLLSIVLASSAAAQFGWSPPALEMALNSTASDTGVQLSADGLTLHFASFRSGTWEIYSSTRATVLSPWSPPVLEASLNTGAVNDGPFMTPDGLEMWFATTAAGGMGGFDIVRATRAAPGMPWGPWSFVTEVNSTGSDAAPSLTDDGLEIYFLTTGHGAPFAPNNAIYRATRTSTSAPFGTPTVVAELLNPNTHRDANVSGDGLSIIYTEFVSPRMRVYQARRLNRSSPFGTPVELLEFANVGTSQGVFSVSPSRSENELLLAANFGTAGSQEIMTSRFDGLTTSGVATANSVLSLHYRDSQAPAMPYAMAASLGNTGFAYGPFTIPLDQDMLFILTLGSDIPPFTSGFLGLLDLQGEAVALAANAAGILSGVVVYVAAVTVDPNTPFGLSRASNGVSFQFQ